MSEQPTAGSTARQVVWPGFGLVMGAGLGSVAGLLFFPAYFVLGTGGGAGLGLVIGAIIEQSRDRGDDMTRDGAQGPSQAPGTSPHDAPPS